MSKAKHPIQPIVKIDKIYRFKENKIVRFLLDFATSRGSGLNELATMGFSNEDFSQLAQLIGYSVYGYTELSYSEKRVKKQIIEELEL